jgi:imidazolonepropionase-like amidohydrolase
MLPLLLLVAQSLTVTAEKVHVGDGRVLGVATVRIDKGRIVAVVPGGDPDADGAHLTPGLVDAYTFLGVGVETVEHAREITAGHRVADTARLDGEAFLRAAREGVTTAYVSPDSLNVIGGLGAIVKTYGGRSADLFAEAGAAARVLQPEAGLRVVIGVDAFYDNYTPSGEFTNSSHARRPTTRMGSVWEIRNAFFTAQQYRAARQGGAKLADRDLDALVAALEGRVPVRVLARKHHDVQTALRLQQEFGWPRMILEEATEGYLVKDLLRQSGVAVVTGPAADLRARSVSRGPTFEQLRFAAELKPICCEHLHEDNPYFAHEPLDEDYGQIELPAYLRDLFLLAAPRYGAAAGFQVGRWQEADASTPALAALLVGAGVPLVLGAGEAYDFTHSEAGAIQQARTAVRWGLPAEQALPLVTSRAAELLGLGSQVGKLAVGFDGDLVLWSGDPLDPASRPLLVAVDGRVVLDQRPKN